MKIVLGLIPSSIRSFIKEQKNGKEELTEEKRHEIAQKIIAKTLKLADPPERSKWRTSAERFRKKLAPAVTRVAGAGVAHVRDVVSMPARFSFADAGGRLSTEGFSSSRRFSDVGLFGHSKRHVRGDETLSLLDVE